MRSGRIWWGVKRKRRYQCHMKTIWENDNDEQAGIKLDSKLRKRRREKNKRRRKILSRMAGRRKLVREIKLGRKKKNDRRQREDIQVKIVKKTSW